MSKTCGYTQGRGVRDDEEEDGNDDADDNDDDAAGCWRG